MPCKLALDLGVKSKAYRVPECQHRKRGENYDRHQENTGHPGGNRRGHNCLGGRGSVRLDGQNTQAMLLPAKERQTGLHRDRTGLGPLLLHATGGQVTVSRQQLLIGQLAKAAGVKPDSVRFYERSGLLSKPERLTSGYRVYGEAALRRLRFIKKAQVLGFSLDEIRRVLRLRSQGQPACDCVMRMAEATLAETEQKLRELQNFAEGLRQNLRHWRKLTKRGKNCAAELCNLIESSGSLKRATGNSGLQILGARKGIATYNQYDERPHLRHDGG
jgi:DNA-binding transcriptional MerR regulator